MGLDSIPIREILSGFFDIVLDTHYLWLPPSLILVFCAMWMYYVKSKFISNLNWVLLEIKLPREILKTPKAMEVIFNGLHMSGGGDFLDRIWKGSLQAWFSAELVGIGGEVHFFIYTQKFFKNHVESLIYSQYPDVEIKEVNDYTSISFGQRFNEEWQMFGSEFVLTADDAYPIKTYIDYGLHETGTKEEYKTDPLTSFVELLGSMKSGEQIWFQILFKGTKIDWKQAGKDLKDKIMGIKPGASSEDKTKATSNLYPGQADVLKAVERSVSKLGFDAGIRMIYLGRPDIFSTVNYVAMIGAMKQYNALNLNGFKPSNATSADYFFTKTRVAIKKKVLLDAYRKRSWFFIPHQRRPFVLNSEELATIYHFPGRVAETPTFGRIEAKKSEAPTNLPI